MTENKMSEERDDKEIVCEHKQRIRASEYYDGLGHLGELLIGERGSITHPIYFAFPFIRVCPDCQYLVWSKGPESLARAAESR